MPKKILILTYYWPPAGGIAVQRWVKLSKYLWRRGWQPVIYTVSNGNYPQRDQSMDKDVLPEITVIRKSIWEPHRLYQLISSRKSKSDTNEISQQKKSWIGKISTWIRSNFFIPDARMFWIRPSVRFLKKYLKDNPVEAIISTGPPHSVHLIAMRLKQQLSIPWLADFRDPWTTMDYYHDLLLTGLADRQHHRLELEVLRGADAVTVVGERMKKEFEQKRGSEVTIVTNGFDEEDFSGTTALDQDFSLLYAGSFFNRINPVNLWKILGELKKEKHPLGHHLKIRIMGHVAEGVRQSIRENGLEAHLEMIPFQPHEVATREMKKAAVLLLGVDVRTKFVLTGKLFEYLGAQRPILAFGPTDGDAAKIISESGAGKMFSFEEQIKLKEHIAQLFQYFQQGRLAGASNAAQTYSHRSLAGPIDFLLNTIIKHR
ncbi:MAG: glycosyltransferase [Bacteroidetes bacterium]|nr:glycosyltransferase [Bacteroidota bacterium]